MGPPILGLRSQINNTWHNWRRAKGRLKMPQAAHTQAMGARVESIAADSVCAPVAFSLSGRASSDASATSSLGVELGLPGKMSACRRVAVGLGLSTDWGSFQLQEHLRAFSKVFWHLLLCC